MADRTGIEWTDATWNPILGCTHVSSGCDHCYAASLASGRLAKVPQYVGLAENGRFNGTIRLLPERLDQPLRWTRPRMIFVNSMSDLFHDGVSDDYIAKVFAVMAAAGQHIFQVLTKRPGRMRSLLSKPWFPIAVDNERTAIEARRSGQSVRFVRPGPWPLPNVWLGTSAEDQRWFDIRWPSLRDTPAAVRFISAEPLLGAIDMEHALRPWPGYCQACGFPLVPRDAVDCRSCGAGDDDDGPATPSTIIRPDWVIVGGESGTAARPMHPGWVRLIRDQCQQAGVAYLFKQWGEWLPVEPDIWQNRRKTDTLVRLDGKTWPLAEGPDLPDGSEVTTRHVGKRAAGRALDGSLYDGYPRPRVSA